jgi:hypothetical protein
VSVTIRGVSVTIRVVSNNSGCVCNHSKCFLPLAYVTILRCFCKIAKSEYQLNHFRPFVSPSAWNNLAPTGRIFIKFDIWGFFENLLRKFKFYYNRTRINGTLHEDQYAFLSYLAHFFLELEMFQTEVVEKIRNTFYVQKLFVENCAVCEIMWKKTVGHGWKYGACALHARYLRLQIHTLRLCNTHCFATATMVARMYRNISL